MQLLEGHLPWIVDVFQPDLVLYDAGVDPHVKDELGKFCLTDQGRSFMLLLCLCVRSLMLPLCFCVAEESKVINIR